MLCYSVVLHSMSPWYITVIHTLDVPGAAERLTTAAQCYLRQSSVLSHRGMPTQDGVGTQRLGTSVNRTHARPGCFTLKDFESVHMCFEVRLSAFLPSIATAICLLTT